MLRPTTMRRDTKGRRLSCPVLLFSWTRLRRAVERAWQPSSKTNVPKRGTFDAPSKNSLNAGDQKW